MEGPTPVSALLHAATMVTAGIYLLVRFNFLIDLIPEILYSITIFGALTALTGSLFALVQQDIKKIIAFSTLSQLGYMFTAIGFSGYNYAMYHLFTHAPFKALLFLSAGIIIHNFNNDQDLRKYGNLVNLMPILYVFNLGGSLALIGFPFFSGFYSKDLIIELTLSFCLNNFFYFLISFCLNFGAFLTTIYSIRLIYYSFFTKLNNLNFLTNLKLIKDLNFIQFYSLILLVFGSIFFGYIFFNYFVGNYSFFF
jgi:NADH:ubiquinone oxidoreductase subunit 5 (subunit L)/multisubunit Na+/H+ antiporter MnhA subunit